MLDETAEIPVPKSPQQIHKEINSILDSLDLDNHEPHPSTFNVHPDHIVQSRLSELSQTNDYDSVRTLAEELATACPAEKRGKLFLELHKLLSSDETIERVFANTLVESMLKPVGLDETVIKHWLNIGLIADSVGMNIDDPYLKRVQAIREYLPSILILEAEKPGIIKYFIDNFSMRSFGSPMDVRHYLDWYETLIQTESMPGESEEQKWRRLITTSLNAIGLSEKTVEDMFQTWGNCSRNKYNSFLTTCKNFGALFEVYAQAGEEPIVKTLIEDFGIHNFDRYKTEMLLSEYQRRNEQGNFGLVVFPKSDWNESFTGNKRWLSQLFEDSEQTQIQIRVIEAGSVSELITRVGKQIRNSKGKISYLILGGHGTLHNIQLGGNNYFQPQHREVIDIEDVLRPKTSLFRKWLVENPAVVLASCSTGGEKGIAQELSNQLNARITAPDKPTSIKSVTLLKQEDGTVILQTEYSDTESKKEFMAGNAKSQLIRPE